MHRLLIFRFLSSTEYNLKTLSRWCVWTCWAMLSSPLTMPRSEANDRCWSGPVLKSSSSFWKSWWATVSVGLASGIFRSDSFVCVCWGGDLGKIQNVFDHTCFCFLVRSVSQILTLLVFKIIVLCTLLVAQSFRWSTNITFTFISNSRFACTLSYSHYGVH